MEEDAKIAAQKSGRLSFYVVNAIADGCTIVYYHSSFCLLKLPFTKWKCGCDIYRFAREDND